MTSRLDIHLLGEFSLRYSDTVVTSVDTPRLQALLAYLVVHCQAPQPRLQLAVLLWPDSAEGQARTNLRNLLHLLRRALPDADRFIAFGAQALQWRDDAPCTLDIADFEAALTRATQAERDGDETALGHALKAAVDLYRGDLLPGCYDDWLLAERERLRQAFVRTLGTCVALLERLRDYPAAIQAAEHLLRQDPLHETTYRHLMRLHAVDGDRAGALRSYYRCATMLQQELGVEPSAATRTLYEQLVQGDGHIAASRSTGSPATVQTLVGRQAEWARLQAAWHAASSGQPQLVLVGGEAGIGKTCLAEELVAWAGRQGFATATARCYAAAGTLAYAPVAAWLRARLLPPLPAVWRSELARVLPELLAEQPDLPPPAPLTEAWQRQRLFEALARGLLGGQQPLLVLIDDLQWCDHDTLEWLSYVLRFDPRARLLVMATVRVEEVDAGHPVRALVADLERDGRVTELELDPLSAPETAMLATSLAKRPIVPEDAARLYAETEGNPLFVVEMVRAGELSRPGAARREAHLPATGAASLPPLMHAVIARRLLQLSSQAQELVGVAATIGRTFTFDLLAQARGKDQSAVLQELDELWHRRIVREHGADAYDFSHDKIRIVAYTALSATRRRLLHRRVAQAYETVAAEPDAVAAQIALHYEQGGCAVQAIPAYRRAAQAARAIYANADAITYLRHGLSLIKTLPRTDRQDANIVLISEELGDMLAVTGQHAAARAAYQAALERVPDALPVHQARLYAKCANTWKAQHRVVEALHDFEHAQTRLGRPMEPGAAWQATWLDVHLDLLNLYYFSGEIEQLAALTREVEPVVRLAGTPAQRAIFFGSVSQMGLRHDRFLISDETLRYAQARMAAALETDDLREHGYACMQIGFCSLWRGMLAEAGQTLETGRALAHQIGDRGLETTCLSYLALAARRRRDVTMVRSYVAQILQTAGDQAATYTALAQANLAWIAWGAGDRAGARQKGETALQQWSEMPNTFPFQWTALWPLIAVALEQERPAAAVRYARALLDLAQQRVPDMLVASIETALERADRGRLEDARLQLLQATGLAETLAYL